MASGCAYCDDIDNIARTLKQDIASQAARQRLAAREPSLVKKIDSGEQLTDNELDILWKEENRSDAIDLMHGKDRNLVDDMAVQAIKSGDENKITEMETEIKKTLEDCIKKGVCGSEFNLGAAAAIGITVTGITAMGITRATDYITQYENEKYAQPYTGKVTTGEVINRVTGKTYKQEFNEFNPPDGVIAAPPTEPSVTFGDGAMIVVDNIGRRDINSVNDKGMTVEEAKKLLGV